jgi:hypothetical protein
MRGFESGQYDKEIPALYFIFPPPALEEKEAHGVALVAIKVRRIQFPPSEFADLFSFNIYLWLDMPRMSTRSSPRLCRNSDRLSKKSSMLKSKSPRRNSKSPGTNRRPRRLSRESRKFLQILNRILQ